MKPSDIPVLILAAGENSRFFPLNSDTHKGGLIFNEKPLIFYTLQGLADAGFRRAVIAVSPKDHGGRGLSGELERWIHSSVVFDGCTILSSISDSIIGSGTTIGKNVTVLTESGKGTIHAMVKGRMVDTGLKRLGVIIGSNATIEPGVMIGSNVSIPQGKRVSQNIPHQPSANYRKAKSKW